MESWINDVTNDMLETLPLTQREVVRLARDEQLHEAAIADRLNLEQGVVASRLFRARMALQVPPKTARSARVKKPKVQTTSFANDVASDVPLPTMEDVEKDIAALRAIKKPRAAKSMKVAEQSNAAMLKSIAKDQERLVSLQAMLDDETQDAVPAPSSTAEDVSAIRSEIEADIPGYTAAIHAAEQQLQQAKLRLATV